jgi:NADPH:quinone reductase-like Zn-dependent oxidoreductase
MRSSTRTKYGPADVITVKDVQKPEPGENEVLVRVRAATVNRTDDGILRGKPFIVRLFTGLPNPKYAITGSDFAGDIESVGRNVQSFKPGDRVMGFAGIRGCGSHAEYMVFPENKGILTIPDGLSYDKATACMEGAFYAASSLNTLKPKPGQTALVNGATGAIGSSLVQILKFYGVRVTAVCAGEQKALVESLGAVKVIDYKTQDFTREEEKYDMIFDTIVNVSFSKCKRLLKDKGIYAPSDGIANTFHAPLTSLLGGKKVFFPVPRNVPQGLRFIKDLIVKGKFRAVIDRKYALEQIKEAYEYVATRQKIGNVIITMD